MAVSKAQQRQQNAGEKGTTQGKVSEDPEIYISSYDDIMNGVFCFKDNSTEEIVYQLPWQKVVREFYLQHSIQILVAVVIFMNFFTAALQAQLLPNENSTAASVFAAFEWFYVYAFLVELLANMYGHFWWEFWKSGWNIFDFFIVLISLIAIYNPDVPALSVLRLFRAFRVIRLFKRVDEMKKIIEGIMKSLPALSYAFIAMGLIIGIWAIMGVDFFGEIESPNQNDELKKGYFFGSFLKAFLSLGQITTFDSWSSGIARDIIYSEGAGAAFYFIIFIFVSGIIMMNVLVALLLDNYLQPDSGKTADQISPEDAVQQLLLYIRNTELDLEQFVNYLNNKAFPDFLANYCKSHEQKTTGEALAAVEMMRTSSFEVECSENSPAPERIDLSKVVSSLARIDNLVTLLEKSNDRLNTKMYQKS